LNGADAFFFFSAFCVRFFGKGTLFLDADAATKINIFAQSKGDLTQNVQI